MCPSDFTGRSLETRIEVEENGSVDSWETLELVWRKVKDRSIRVMSTENPGHAADHQELGPGDGGNCSTGLHPLPFCASLCIITLPSFFYSAENKLAMKNTHLIINRQVQRIWISIQLLDHTLTHHTFKTLSY